MPTKSGKIGMFGINATTAPKTIKAVNNPKKSPVEPERVVELGERLVGFRGESSAPKISCLVHFLIAT